MRVKVVRNKRGYQVGEVLELPPKLAKYLIKSGIAIISKDMASDDYKQAGENNGEPTVLRSVHTS